MQLAGWLQDVPGYRHRHAMGQRYVRDMPVVLSSGWFAHRLPENKRREVVLVFKDDLPLNEFVEVRLPPSVCALPASLHSSAVCEREDGQLDAFLNPHRTESTSG